MLQREFLREHLLLVNHDVEILFGGDELLVDVISALFQANDLLLLFLVKTLHLILCGAKQVAVVHLTVEL